MPITQFPTNKKFSHVVHLSDIHIRLTKRHDEYREVFHKLFEDIYKTPPTTAIFILGDIVNSKLDLSPECVDLAADFLKECANLRPTILITGNHDTNLTNRSRMDSLSPIVDAINHPNLFYLKESGLYGLGNICINNYSVFDTPDKYLRGKDIPAIYRNQFECFVATYHGIVDGVSNDLGFKLFNPTVKVDMFDNHDIVMMGDVHKKQDLQSYDYNTGKPIIRYAGSLIQQRHDEPLEGHGYTLWDLENFEYEHIEVQNDYGFFTVVVENGVIISDLSDIPKKTRLRIQLRNTTPSEIKSTIIQIKQLTEVIEISYDRLDKQKSLTRIPSISGNEVLGDVNDKQYQTFLITNYLKNSLGITDINVISSVIKINDDINDVIKKDDFARNIRWIPIKFEFENMFSYGEGNIIDFTKVKDLVGLFAANASGKSTIFSALTFCLFDKCERASDAIGVMNDKKDTFKCKFEFEINGKRYFITRDAKKDIKGKVKVNVRFWKVEDGKEIDLNGEQRRNTNEIIREYLGSYEDFVLTSLSVQNGKNTQSIIDMGNTDRKDLFAQFMGLTMFDRLYSEGNERLKERLVMLKTYRNDDYTSKLINYENFLNQANLLYNSEQDALTEIGKRRDLLQQMVVDTTKKLIKLESDIPYHGYSNTELNKYNTLSTNDKIRIVGIEKEIENIEKELKVIDGEILELEEKNTTEISNTFRELGNKKRDIEYKREKLKLDYIGLMRVCEKAQNLDYNPECDFCVKHAGVIAQDAKEATEKIQKIQEDATKMKDELESVEKQIEESKWSFDANLKLMGLLTKRNKLKDNKIKFSEQISKLKDDIRVYEEMIKKHEKNIGLYNKNKESILLNEEINKEIEKYNNELSNSAQLYRTKSKTLIDIHGKISICKNQISEINNKINQIKIIEQEYKLYELYCQSVSRDGIVFDVISATITEVQTEVNSILSQICDFSSSFEIDGKNIIPYIVYDDRKWLMSLTSGFEKFALSLAIRVALINISNLPKMSGLVVDEGFGVLDAENLSQMNTLFSYLKSQFDFIIIISHLEGLRDIVDKHIEITKDNNVSRVNFV